MKVNALLLEHFRKARKQGRSGTGAASQTPSLGYSAAATSAGAVTSGAASPR